MFFGSIVAIVTPFMQGQVDLVAFKKLLQLHIDSRTHGMVVCGSTGEGSMLTMNERESLIKAAIQCAASKLPIIAGCSAGSTHECLVLLQQAQSLGCTAALVIPPYYVRPKAEGVMEHFRKLTELTQIPLILYNNPGRVGVDLSVELILELAQLLHVIGIKDSHPDLTRLAHIRLGIHKLKQQGKIPQTKPFSIFSGDSSSFGPALALGADGCISVTANILPKLSATLYEAWKNSDMETFKRIRDELLLMDDALGCEVNPIPIKYAVSKLGLCNPEMRLPLTAIDPMNAKKIDAVFERLNITIKEQAA